MRLCPLLLILVLMLVPTLMQAQATCTTLGQTPKTAFPVCGTSTFTQSNVPTCGGRNIPGPCTGVSDVNPFWYRFTCYTAGTLGLTITPNQMSDDYDWQIFDVTNSTDPDEVYTNSSLFVACSWSGTSGVTGTSPTGVDLINCAGNSAVFSRMPTLVAGHTYLLMVSNWSASQQGYKLEFTGGTAVITDPLPPQPASVTPNCDGTRIVVAFNKKMKCSSLAANGSDFEVQGPTPGNVQSAVGFGCTNSFDLDSIALFLADPLPPGIYTVVSRNGTDGNTLLDNCSTELGVGIGITFAIGPQGSLPMGATIQPPCAPQTIMISFPENINCSSISADGSDFVITGPSAVTVTGATGSCSNGSATDIMLQLGSPILVPGIYTVTMNAGSDGNTLVGECSRAVAPGETATFTVLPEPPLPMGSVAQPNCAPSTITFNLPEPVLCNSIAGNGSDFVITGPSTVSITNASVSCDGNGRSTSVTLHLAAPITVPGDYQLAIAMGSDGNTIIGSCIRMLVVGETADFNIPFTNPVAMGTIQPLACGPATIQLEFPEPIRCSSIAPDGSDFILTGPSAVTITGATIANCDANGLTRIVTLQLSSIIGTGGNYQVALTNGSDGNTVLSECYQPSIAGAVATFTATDGVTAAFQYTVMYDCQQNTVTFSHDGANGVNSWEWKIDGSVAGSQSTLSRSFSASSQQQVQLTVSNGVCTDTHSESIVFDNKLTAAFDAPEMACTGDPVQVRYQGTGQPDRWNWDFGNGQTSTLQDPPPVVYPPSMTDRDYIIRLSMSDDQTGCQTSVTRTIKILASCRIEVPTAFTPNNDGLNDELYPLNAFKADNLEFRVYNRWGQLVFFTTDWMKRWDGKINGVPQATGIYVWMLNYVDRDTKEKISKKGQVLLMR